MLSSHSVPFEVRQPEICSTEEASKLEQLEQFVLLTVCSFGSFYICEAAKEFFIPTLHRGLGESLSNTILGAETELLAQ